jgi:hypothetical protein
MTTGIGGLGMTRRTRDLAKWGAGGVTGGNGQVTRLGGLAAPARSGSLVHGVGPACLACRIGARAGSVDLARERGPEAPAPSPGATGKAGDSAQRTR